MNAALDDYMPSMGTATLEAPARADDGFQRIADGTGLFRTKGEPDLVMGTDGDDRGNSAHHQQVSDMLDSGHGFLVSDVPKPRTERRTTCEICAGPLPTPGNDPDWFCQLYDETRRASLDCNCAWCLRYQDYLAGKYQPRGGRPRQRCGSAECEREAAKLRKRKQRGVVVEPVQPSVERTDVTEQSGLRNRSARGLFQGGYGPRIPDGPGPWFKPRQRNEPIWSMSHRVRVLRDRIRSVSQKPHN